MSDRSVDVTVMLSTVPDRSATRRLVRSDRVRERPRRFGPDVLPIAGGALLLLCLDLGLIARLLDGVTRAGGNDVGDGPSGVPTMLASFSAGLFAWSVAVLLGGVAVLWPLRRHRRRTLLALAVTAAVLPQVVGRWMEARLLDHADAQWRRSAVRIESLLPAIRDGAARVPGLDLAPIGDDRAGDEALLLLLPAVTVADGALDGPADPALRALLLAVIEHQSGGAAAAYDERFVPSVRALRDAFNRYAERQRVLASALATAVEQAESAWRTESAGTDPPSAAVRDIAIARAVAAAREVAESGFAADIASAFGARLPPGLTWAAFTAAGPVQARWRASIGAPDGAALAPGMGFAAFDATIYRPEMDTLVAARFGAALKPLSDYADTGPAARAGLTALRTAFLPIVSLAGAIALLGAAVTVLSICALEMGPRPRSRLPAAALAVAILCWPFLHPDEASRSRGFAELDTALFTSEGAIAALAARWWVEAAPVLRSAGSVIDEL